MPRAHLGFGGANGVARLGDEGPERRLQGSEGVSSGVQARARVRSASRCAVHTHVIRATDVERVAEVLPATARQKGPLALLPAQGAAKWRTHASTAGCAACSRTMVRMLAIIVAWVDALVL